MILLPSTQLTIECAMRNGTPVIRGKYNQRILGDAQLLKRIHKFTNLMIHVLHKGHIGRPLLAQLWLTFLYLFKPVLGRLDRKVRCIVSQDRERKVSFHQPTASSHNRWPSA